MTTDANTLHVVRNNHNSWIFLWFSRYSVDRYERVCNNPKKNRSYWNGLGEECQILMVENEATPVEGALNPEVNQTVDASKEEISYHAVEKDGVVTAIWEMQGRKHLRTIDPRSRQGQDILRLYTTEHHDETT